MASKDSIAGQAALAAGDYALAITHLTIALQTSHSPLWLIQRATAYQRTSQHALALADADAATLAAHARGKRELIATAQFRRAVALHGLGRFGDARMCLVWAQKFNDKEKGVTMWQAKVKSDYDRAGGEGSEVNRVTVREMPEEAVVMDDKPAAAKKAVDNKENKLPVASAAKVEKIEKVEKVNTVPTVSTPAVAVQTPKEKVRNEWYQSNTTVTIEIFAKGIPKDTAEVNIREGSLDVTFPIATFNSSYDYTLSPLFSKVDPSKSSYRVTPHKIEIVLHKSVAGLKWSALEGTTPIETATVSEPTSKIPEELLKDDKAPAYPTSSRNGPKNWDNIGDDKDDEVEEIDGFFKKLYKDADPDTKRAMMKSYQESNGTALSTSWSDVASKKVETQPPEGLEAKKWEF